MDRKLINNLILDGRLYRASVLLKHELVVPSLEYMEQEVDKVLDSYKRMIEYMANGVEDDQRENVHQYMQRSLLEISDKIYFSIRLQNSSDDFYISAKIRNIELTLSELLEEVILLSHEDLSRSDRATYDEIITKIFTAVWTSPSISNDDIGLLQSCNDYIRKHAVSAMMLSLVHFFDLNKITFIISELKNKSISASYRVRLASALMYAIQRYPRRILLYKKDLEGLLKAANEAFPLKDLMAIIYRAYVLEYGTYKTCETLSSTIPNVQKALDSYQHKSDIVSSIIEDLEENKWKNNDDNSLKDIFDDLYEVSQLEKIGADIFYLTFSKIKMTDFFSKTPNWFLPFDENHSLVKDTSDNETQASLFSLLKLKLCDSDLYSLSTAIHPYIIPNEMFQDGMAMNIEEETKVLQAMIKSEEKELEDAARKYMQDIYRFENLARVNTQKFDIFNEFKIFKWASFPEYIPSKDFFIDLADFVAPWLGCKEAKKILDMPLFKGDLRADYLALRAKCHFFMSDYEKAILDYEKADLIEDLKESDAFRLARSYRLLNRSQKAIEIYQRFQNKPSSLLKLAATYIEIKEYDKALPLLFEFLYKSKNEEKAYRPLAWSLFMTRDFEKALFYYEKIPNPSAIDLVNKGYVLTALQRYNDAIISFRIGMQLDISLSSSIFAIAERDIDEIEKIGISRTLIFTLIDAAQMKNNN